MKSEKRKKALVLRRAAKERKMSSPGAKSKYAQKKREQSRGNYRPTSPFYQIEWE